jgi:GT2 family glycosyltransferase
MPETNLDNTSEWPTVTVVFLAFNRREELRESLRRTLRENDYPADRTDVIVVDNASADGTSEMVRQEFPAVQLITRNENIGVSGWNDGFAVATGEWVLALDDDCYLPPQGLREAVSGVRDHSADLASFGVTSSHDYTHRFDHEYRTGLLTFWGCAVLVRREALEKLTGYDPEIFVWANELEFMLRFFDSGYRHLHLPETIAIHAKEPGIWQEGSIPERPYRINAHNFAYVAAKFLRPREAVETFIALLARNARDALRSDRVAWKAVPDTFSGFAHGLRHRRPVAPEISRYYRRNFETFAAPWALSRTPATMVRDALTPASRRAASSARRAGYFEQRADAYPDTARVLGF